jgi:hypothetical protein
MPVTIGQVTYNLFPSFANPGQLADCAFNEIESFTANEVIFPGRCVEIAADGLSVQMVQQTGTTFAPLGVAILQAAREGAGAVGVAPYGVGGIQFNLGDTVPVLMRGRIWGEWKGTTQTAWAYGDAGAKLNVYHSSTLAADRGKFTDAAISAGAGVEIAIAGKQFRTRQSSPGTGSIILVDINLPGAA